jgi:predicted transcriptional regulator
MSPSVEAVELVARRADLLRELRDGPKTKPALADALDVSRSTVDRAVRELEREEYVCRRDGIALALKGRLVLSAYEEFAANLDALDTAEPAIDTLPVDAQVDDTLFRGGEVVEADSVAPQRATERFRQLVEEAERIRGYASALLDSTVPTYRRRMVEDGMEVELVIAPEVLDALVTGHGDAVADARATGNLTLLRATETIAYSLMLVDDGAKTHVCALFYDENGHTGLLRNDDPEAVVWASGLYADLRAAAEPLPD